MWFSTAFYACLFLAAVNAEKLASETIGPENTKRDKIHSGCILPEQPIGGSFKLDSCTESLCNIVPGKIVPSGSRLTYRCDENDGYILKGDAVSSCHIDKWHLIPTCIKYCSALRFESIEALCLYDGRPVSCDVPTTPGTKATLACKDSYKILPMDYDPAIREITCLDGGVWSPTVFQCVPECGMAVAHERYVNDNGSPVEHGSFPWHVAIYKRTSIINSERVCAGTLVRPNLVISAAHCFFDETVGKLTNASQFSVVAGKYYRLYNESEYYSQESGVRKIDVTLRNSGARQNYEQDIALVHLETAFAMTTFVRPVCVDWYNSHGIEQLPMGSIGMTAWSGETTEGSPYEKLQEVHISYIPFKDCLTAAPENFKGLITADKFCGSRFNESRSCAGDSGGGLYFQLKGFWFLRGIISVTSVSNEMHGEYQFVAFTNVGHFLEWIRDAYHSTGNGRSRGDNRTDTYGMNYNNNASIRKYGGSPWRQRNKHYSEGVLGLHEEIEDFFTYMSPTLQEQTLRLRTMKRIEDVVNDLLPDSKVQIFGSFATGLYLPTSDIDLVVKGMWITRPLRRVEKALLDRNIAERTSIKVIDDTRMPIIKLTDKETKIQVDISFETHSYSLGSTELIKSYKRRFPVLEKLVMILKQFLTQRDLNTFFTGGVASYALVLMTISFLQLHPRQNVNCPNPNLGLLLIEFLELYGRKFNYVETCISVKDGRAHISKKEVHRRMIDESSLFCVEDPFNPENSIGHMSHKILQVKEAFDWAHSVLSQAVSSNNVLVNDAHEVGILDRIIRVKDDVVDYRKGLKEIFSPLHGETEFLSNSTGAESSTLAAVAGDTD